MRTGEARSRQCNGRGNKADFDANRSRPAPLIAEPRGGRTWNSGGGEMPGSGRALFLLAGLTGCTGADVDLNPFYVGRVHETERGKESRMISAGPMWDDARSPDRRE